MHALRTMLLSAALLPAAVGCSLWQEPMAEPLDLPPAKMSRDSVVLEIAFVRLPSDQQLINDRIWTYVDEQHLVPEHRRHLNQNGIRCGLVGVQLPAELRELLDSAASSQGPNSLAASLDVFTRHRRLQARAGRRNEIVVSPVRDEMHLLHRPPAGEAIRGKSFEQAQAMLAATAQPQGNGSVHLELVPELHFGTPRRQWVGSEGTFQLKTGRQRDVLNDLTITTQLAPGQTLLLGCTPEAKGVGALYFVDTENGDPQRKLLLIRLAQSQRDDLFSDPPDSPAANALSRR